jgi:predicted acetyltransferase
MDIKIEPIEKGKKEILRNLFEKYDYELSQYTDQDVNDLGLYGFDYLDYYWTESNRYAFFIKINNKLAGFILVNDYPAIRKLETNYTMDSFFIMYRYRRQGIGKLSVKYILDKFKGKWQLNIIPKNKLSKDFWIKTIDEYTNGKYEIIENATHDDGYIGHIIVFES